MNKIIIRMLSKVVHRNVHALEILTFSGTTPDWHTHCLCALYRCVKLTSTCRAKLSASSVSEQERCQHQEHHVLRARVFIQYLVTKYQLTLNIFQYQMAKDDVLQNRYNVILNTLNLMLN